MPTYPTPTPEQVLEAMPSSARFRPFLSEQGVVDAVEDDRMRATDQHRSQQFGGAWGAPADCRVSPGGTKRVLADLVADGRVVAYMVGAPLLPDVTESQCAMTGGKAGNTVYARRDAFDEAVRKEVERINTARLRAAEDAADLALREQHRADWDTLVSTRLTLVVDPTA